MGVPSIVRDAEKLFLGQEGVVGVGVSDPEGYGEIIVYVESPEKAMALPRVFDGVPVRVIVAGKPRIFPLRADLYSLEAFRTSNRDLVRPAVGGVSISDPTGTAGTLSMVTGALQIFSNAHVFGIDWEKGEPYPPFSGTPVLQPGRYDGGTDRDVIGKHVSTVLDEHVDLAVAIGFPDRVKPEYIWGGVRIDGWTLPYRGMAVSKVGRTTGMTSSVVIDVHGTVKVWGYPGGPRVFRDQVVVANPLMQFMAPGDSGSLLYTIYGGRALAVGLCFAGSEFIALANKIEYVVAKGLVIGGYVPVKPPSWGGLIGNLGASLTPVSVAVGMLMVGLRQHY